QSICSGVAELFHRGLVLIANLDGVRHRITDARRSPGKVASSSIQRRRRPHVGLSPVRFEPMFRKPARASIIFAAHVTKTFGLEDFVERVRSGVARFFSQADLLALENELLEVLKVLWVRHKV